MAWFITALVVAGLLTAFWLGMKYGLTLESEAFAEVSKIRAACAQVGLKFETLVAGDIAKAKAELIKILSFPAEQLKKL